MVRKLCPLCNCITNSYTSNHSHAPRNVYVYETYSFTFPDVSTYTYVRVCTKLLDFSKVKSLRNLRVSSSECVAKLKIARIIEQTVREADSRCQVPCACVAYAPTANQVGELVNQRDGKFLNRWLCVYLSNRTLASDAETLFFFLFFETTIIFSKYK